MGRIFVALGFLVLSVATAVAIGPVVGAGCKLEWTEPQTNTDGSNLADLAEYRIFISQTSGTYGATPAKVIPAPAADPPTGAVVNTPCPSGIPQGQNFAVLVAADTAGNSSPRSNEAPFFLDTVAPSGATGFQVKP